MEVIPMSRNRRYNPYRKETDAPKIDLDDKNEIAADKEAERRETEAAVNDKTVIEDMELLQERGPKYFEKIQHPVQEMPKKQPPQFVQGIVKVLSNMRAAPNMDAMVLEVLKPGTSIMIYEDTPGDFYRVVHEETEGYIKKELCARVGFGVSHLY